MICKKTVSLIMTFTISAGMLLNSGSSAAAETAAGVLNGGYLQVYEHNIPNDTAASGTPVVQAADLPEVFDLRDIGCVTPVRNQGAEGMCFAFAALGACESNLLLQGLETDCNALDLSEAHMGYFSYTEQEDPLDPLSGDYYITADKGASGGNGIFAAAALASGIGTQLETFCDYSDWNAGYSAYQRYGGRYRLRSMENITQATDDDTRAVIKEWIMETGGVSIAFYSKRSLYYDNGTSYSYYAADKSFYTDANHAALIVGWDDNYSRENFDPESRPDYDGAWLVKNSYGVDLFDDGYFWLSYEDPTTGSFCSYDLMPAEQYDDVYEYDGAGYVTAYSDIDAAANIFVAEYSSILSDVAFYMPSANMSNASYDIRVYKLHENTDDPTDGKLAATASGTIVNGGYYTVPLDDTVQLEKGEQFSVVLRIKTAYGQNGYIPLEEEMSIAAGFDLSYHANAGESYVLKGRNWTDSTELIRENDDGEEETGVYGNALIKALTVRTESSEPLRLEAALALAEAQTDTASAVLSEAVQQGTEILVQSAGASAYRYASAALLSVLETETGTVTYPEALYTDMNVTVGDGDESGKVDIADASAVLQIYAKRSAGYIIRLRQAQTYAMDAAPDGMIGLDDGSEILKKYAESAAAIHET